MAPSLTADIAEPGSLSPVSRMRRARGAIARDAARNWAPFMNGIRMSEMMTVTSGMSRSTSSASAPLPANITV